MRTVRLTLAGKGSADRLLGVLRAAAETEGFTLTVESGKGPTCADHGVELVCPTCQQAERGARNKGRALTPEALEQRRLAARRPRPGRRKAEGAGA